MTAKIFWISPISGTGKATNFKFCALLNGTIPDPPLPPLPQDWGSQPHQNSNAIISGMGKATDFKFGCYIHGYVHPNKSPLKILEKRKRGRIQRQPNFFKVPPIISGTGKATNFKILYAHCRTLGRLTAY